MTDQSQSIFPTMHFANGDAALAWLARTLGFREERVHRDERGVIHHAEMSLDGARIMFGQGEAASQGIYVAVDDIDGHYAQAKSAGATITRELKDTPYGAREYSLRDPAGHDWSFGTYRPGQQS